MKFLLLLLTFVCATIASPHLWRPHGRKYQHQRLHHKHRSSKSHSISSSTTSTSSTSSTSSSSSTTLTSTSTGASSYQPTAPTAGTSVGTSSRASVSVRSSGTQIGTSSRPSASVRPSGTTVGTSSRPSASVRPSGTKVGTSSRSFGSVKPSGTTGFARTGTAPYPTTSSTSPPEGTPCPDFLRGVNIGGWLLLDSTLNSNLLNPVEATTQWDFDSTDNSAATLDDHWNTYFTEADVQLLKSAGVNAIKIPVGYWAWDNSGTPYKQGADAYLEKAIGWAASAGMKVWIDVSNLDKPATAESSRDRALSYSLAILEKIATKYGSAAHASTVVALHIFPCPIGYPDPSTHDQWVSKAYSTIRSAAENRNLQVVMSDHNSAPADLVPTAQSLSSTKGMFAAAESFSELTCPCEQEMSQVQHIQRACERGYNIAGLNHDDISIYVGDFNPATNATLHSEGWTEDVVTDVRKYVEANLSVFEAYTSGYFFWSWSQSSETVAGVGWGFKDGLEKGYIPSPLNDLSQRKYPNQCDV